MYFSFLYSLPPQLRELDFLSEWLRKVSLFFFVSQHTFPHSLGFTFPPKQCFSTFLMLPPFIQLLMVWWPTAMKLILLLIHNCDFAAVMNWNVKMWHAGSYQNILYFSTSLFICSEADLYSGLAQMIWLFLFFFFLSIFIFLKVAKIYSFLFSQR